MKPPTQPNSSGSTGTAPLALVRSYHRRVRLSLLLWALAAILASFAAVQAEALGWWRDGFLFGFGLSLVAAALVIFWLRRVARTNVTQSVRALDSRWAMQARLESTLELAEDNSLLASTHREETGQRVSGKKAPHGWWWYSAQVLVGLLGLVLLSELGVGVLATKAESKATAAQKSSKTPEAKATLPAKSDEKKKSDPETPVLDSFAEIKWISPESKSRATAIEEVWLKAAVETRSGLRNVALEISVNGGTPHILPIAATTGAKVALPGSHELEQAIYLDELSVEEYDVVSYFLRADPNGKKASPITSPLQFIQIRAAREEVGKGSPDDKDASEIISLLYRLQSLQLDLLQQNFLLAKTNIKHTDDFWQQSNRTVADQQAQLAGKVTELRTLAVDQASPAILVDNLGQASTLMASAAGLIKKESNDAAIPAQQKALALLAECDRLFHKTLTGPPPKDNATDPFRDKQEFVLPERSKTPAGELEALAQKQEKILSELTGMSGQAGTPVPQSTQEGEAALAGDAQRLGEKGGLEDKAKPAARRAADEAKIAGQRMAAGDAKGSVTPATAAAEALRDALAEQEMAGRMAALAALEAGRRELNAASRITDKNSRAARMTELVTELERAAEQQQRTGLAEAAEQLAKIANGTRRLKSTEPGSEAWQAGIRQAAATQVVVATRRDAIRRAGRQLERGRLALSQPGEFPGRADVELAAQIAREVFPDSISQEAARALEVAAASRQDAITSNATLSELCETVQRSLLKLRTEGERDERVRRYNANDIDPAYRSAVEEYFERLSREGTQR